MRTRINEIHKQIVTNENKTLSNRVNSPGFRCKEETQVYHPRTGLNYLTKIHAQFLGKVRGIEKGIDKG